jgi:hypothetical protein
MISGLVSPKSIGLMNGEDINQSINKSKLIFKASKLMIIIVSFTAFSISMVPLILNSSFPIILFQVFRITLYTVFGYFSIKINFYQMTYFYIICLYLKLKLRNAKNSIKKSFEKMYKMTNHGIKNILISLDSTIS